MEDFNDQNCRTRALKKDAREVETIHIHPGWDRYRLLYDDEEEEDESPAFGLLHSSPCANPLDCDNDLNCDRSKRLNDILAGHDIALLKMVKKVAKQTLLILSDNNLTLFLYSRPLSFSSFVKVDMYSRTIVPICLPNPRDSYLINVSSLDHN